MDVEFNSLEELYKRLKPALAAKISDIHRSGFKYIKEEDIWNYLKEIRWTKSKDLNLYQMVDDVLNADEIAIDNYLKEKIASSGRMVYITEED